ncbi:MAG: hypothetical protein N2235_19845 [Fischerella sp.]|nr:hypothetical protein [Fischerella sp.]
MGRSTYISRLIYASDRIAIITVDCGEFATIVDENVLSLHPCAYFA